MDIVCIFTGISHDGLYELGIMATSLLGLTTFDKFVKE